MRSSLSLLRDRDLRRYFAAWAASSAGTGAGYVALLLAAQQRIASGWVVGGVLLAQFLPSMLLGSRLGGLVDRRPARICAVAADLIGAVAFVALAVVASAPALLALAAVAGLGAALAAPAHMALLPSVAGEERTSPATALYGAIDEAGYLLGPLLAAAVLAVAPATWVLVANAATFAVSALLLASLRLRTGESAAGEGDEVSEAAPPAAVPATESALRVARRLPAVPAVLVASTVAVAAVGLANVGEVLFATRELHAGGAGLSLLIAAMSVGMTIGSLTSASAERVFRRRYVLGLAAMGIGLLTAASTLVLVVALAGMLVSGWGNGAALAHERLLLQHAVPDGAKGRVFGLRRLLFAWSYCAAYLLAAPIASAGSARGVLIVAGGLSAVAATCAAAGLLRPRGRRVPAHVRALATGGD